MSKFAVVDVETTGLGNADRVVEIAVVVMDAASWQIVDEFDTLVNPQRDIGAVQVHGITATMVETAPTFAEIAGSIARVVGGNVLAAHNLPFDQRFLLAEFSRAGVPVEPGHGADTLRLTGERLDLACARFGVPLTGHHRALADARATAALLAAVGAPEQVTPVSIGTSLEAGIPRTLRRDSVGGGVLPVSPSRFRVRYPTVDEMAASYLNTLDAFLDDLVLDEADRRQLDELSALYGLRSTDRDRLHAAYFQSLVAAARRDGVVSEAEQRLIVAVSAALGVDPALVPEVTETPTVSTLDGQRVCFTGTFTVAGVVMEKDQLERIAANAGLQPVESVTKSGCDLLVAADPASSSGKALKARQFGIPVMGMREFMERIEAQPGR